MRILPTIKHILLFSIVLSALVLNTGYCQGRWDTISSAGFTARFLHACVSLDGKIYVIGGLTPDSLQIPVNTINVYDPESNTWSTPTTTGDFIDRYGFTADVINGKIYVLGGYNDSLKKYFSDVSVFDPANNSWSIDTTTGDYIARAFHTSAVINSKIYVIGGLYPGGIMNSIDVFDPATDTWSQLDETGDVELRYGASAASFNNKIYIAGGRNYRDKYITTIDEFDLNKNEWRTLPTIGRPASSCFQTAQFLGGKMYISGGHYGNSLVTKFKSYDPLTDSVSLVETTGTYTPRYGLSSCVLNGKLYVIGGKTLDSTVAPNEVFTLSNLATSSTTSNDLTISLPINPVNDKLIIMGLPDEHVNITVTNIIGKTVLQTASISDSEYTLDVSSLPAGVYFISLQTSDSVITRRFIRQ